MSDIRTVVINSALENDLVAACRLRLPNETCGLIFGTIVGGTTVAEAYTVMRNVSLTPSRSFRFDPAQWVSSYYEAQKNQRNIVGFFHSHPHGDPLPSVQDGREWTPWGTYWIVGFAESQGQIVVYRMDSRDRWIKLPVLREFAGTNADLDKHTDPLM